MIKRTLSFVLLLSLPPAASALDLESHPGYVDLSTLEQAIGGQAMLSLDFDRDALAGFLDATGNADPQVAALVDSVAQVQVRAFDLDAGQAEDVNARIADAADELRAAGWGTLASVNDQESRIHVFMKTEGPYVVGLVGMFGADGKAGYVHVLGEIDAAKVMAAFLQHGQSLHQLFSAAKVEAEAP